MAPSQKARANPGPSAFLPHLHAPMQRTFLTNLALVLVLNLLVKPFYILGIDAEVQVRAGTEAYGSYAALLSLSFLFNIVLDLGITNWNTRHVATEKPAGAEHLGGILGLRALLGLAYGLLLVLVGLVLGYRGAQLALLAVLGLNQLLAATLLFLRSNIAGRQRFAEDSLLSVLDRALLIGICAWLLWGRSSGAAFPIMWFARAQTAAYAVAVLVAALLVARRAGRFTARWDRASMIAVVRGSFPYALLVLLMSFYYRTDMVMLERMLPDGAVQAGIYAQGFRFFEALNMFGFLVAGLLLPMFSRMLARGEAVAPLTGLATRLMLCASLAVAVLVAFHARAVMDLRYTEHTAESAPAFALLMGGFVGVCVSYVFGTLLTAAGELRSLNRLAAAAMVLNIGLNLVLIPRYHAFGAALAGLITQLGSALAQALLARRHFALRCVWADARPLLLYVLLLTAGMAALWFAGAGLLWSALALAIGAPTLALVTGTLSLPRLADILKASGTR